MSVTTTPSASDLARHTPASRDRYVDFLRIASIAVVVLGHWLMAVVTVEGGEFRTGNVLGMVPGLWLATWVLQVMPIFFFVGGFANFVTIDATRKRCGRSAAPIAEGRSARSEGSHVRGRGATEYLVGRVQRLVWPVATLFAIWVPVSLVLPVVGIEHSVLAKATRLVCQPLWFIGVYLMVSALAPAMRDLHARHRFHVLAALAAAAVVVDIVRFGAGLGAVGYLNVAFVWLFAQQLGFFYADGTLTRIAPARLLALATTALAALAVLTTFGPYPNSMVGLTGERVSNMAPPTICLLALTVFQVALAMVARPAVNRWLQRERVWTGVVAGNGVIMTVFLWHVTALLAAVLVLYPLGFPQPEGGTALWWTTRPLLLLASSIPLAGFVALFGRNERPRPNPFVARDSHGTLLAGIGVALVAVGITSLATANLADLVGGGSKLVFIPVTPLTSAAQAVLGWVLLRTSVRTPQLDRFMVDPITADPITANPNMEGTQR